nr:LysR substrate-binding domain-containing protein [Rhizobium sp. L1K21]
MEKLPPLTALAAFDAFHRSGSVAGAARLLGRTHGAVSKQLHQLQDTAGVTLFRKNGLHLELTRPGLKFAQSVTRNMDDLRRAYTELRGPTDDKSVKLAISSTFAKQWAIPTIARFNNDHPEIEVMIRIVGPQGSRSLEDSVDLVLSWDRLLSSDIEHPDARSLGDVHMGVVLSADYPHRAEKTELRLQTIIHRRGNEAAWPKWSHLTGIRIAYDREITFDLLPLVFEAAERGMGAAIAPKFLIENELKTGRLIAPYNFHVFKDGLIVRPSSERPRLGAHAKIFFDWLVENAQLSADGFIDAKADSMPVAPSLLW